MKTKKQNFDENRQKSMLSSAIPTSAQFYTNEMKIEYMMKIQTKNDEAKDGEKEKT